MFGTRWQLFRLRGIPVNVDASWFLVVALMTWTLTGHFQAEAPGLAVWDYWLMGLGTTLAFFACIVLHELGHALVAQRAGIPLRGITLFLFGGVAEMEGEPASAGREFLMAIAGPVVSAVLAAVFGGLAAVGARVEWVVPAVVTLQTMTWINLSVLVFNLVPAFPLDGGRVLRSILWGVLGNLRRATYWASLLGQGFAWLLMGLGVLQFVAGNPLGGMWLVLIGLFLSSAAQGSYQQVVARQVLKGEPVRRFMNTEPIVVSPSLDLRQWVEDYVYRYHHKTYPVGTNGLLEGVITTEVLARYPRTEWDRHTVAEVMRQDLETISLPPDADALQALEQMQRTGSSRLLVTDNGRLVGLLSLKDLLRFLELKLELEQGDEDASSGTSPSWRNSDRKRETAAHR
jgi:Zn-dependent protease/CBS domain-containing protein